MFTLSVLSFFWLVVVACCDWASEEMINNATIVMATVHQNGRAFDFTTKEMKDSEVIILAAIRLKISYLGSDNLKDKGLINCLGDDFDLDI